MNTSMASLIVEVKSSIATSKCRANLNRCSVKFGAINVGSWLCALMWLVAFDHTFSIGLRIGLYGPNGNNVFRS